MEKYMLYEILRTDNLNTCIKIMQKKLFDGKQLSKTNFLESFLVYIKLFESLQIKNIVIFPYMVYQLEEYTFCYLSKTID